MDARGMARARLAFACFVCVAVAGAASASTVELIPAGADWRYDDQGNPPAASWTDSGFDDASWSLGPAQLGYGDGDEATTVDFGPDPLDKHITTYLRHSFSVSDPSQLLDLTLEFLRDDGGVVYLNGVEVFRSNMPDGPIDGETLASVAISGSGESTFVPVAVDTALLTAGTNVVAVEVHQAGPTSSDLSFDLRLQGTATDSVVRGPYLQRGTSSSVIVRWRTAVATDSVVRAGAAPGQVDIVAEDFAATTEHEVELTGLDPSTTYYYSVGSSAGSLAGGDAETYFVTAPGEGDDRAFRVWVLGDSGTANGDAASVRDAYEAYAGDRHTDLWLLLGDNAYPDGKDAEYQAALFDMYPEMLRKSTLWPALGNHDRIDTSVGTWPYMDMFSLPEGAQAGGAPSGSEAYYSFDYGNVHFVVLDSFDSPSGAGSAQLQWLELDLASTTQEWVVAYWHHPPYSKGSHDSDDALDSGGRLFTMRENAVPILEEHGVDLILSGHSHSYERSFLLNGHHGLSNTLDASMVLDPGDGRLIGDGFYSKQAGPPQPGAGAVFVVAGSSGKITGGSLDHPAMFVSYNRLGSLVLDVDGSVLTARFLDDDGSVADHFTLVKGNDSACIPGVLVPNEASWRYLDDGSDAGTAWREPGYDDSGWSSGPAPLGYGDGDEATEVGFGPDPANRYVTTYFRTTIDAGDVSTVSALGLRLQRDDGAVVYVNGTEVLRSNIVADPVEFDSFAATSVSGAAESEYVYVDLDPSVLVSGDNVIAVEVHQATIDSTDLSFDLELVADYCREGIDPSVIFADDFESGALGPWTSVNSGRGDLRVSPQAALEGSFGLELVIDDRNLLTLRDDRPDSERTYQVSFLLDPNGISIPSSGRLRLLRAFTAGPPIRDAIRLELREVGSGYQMRARVKRDNGGPANTSWIAVPDEPVAVELRWQAATAPGAKDGRATLFVGSESVQLSDLDNDLTGIDWVIFGASRPVPNGTAGTLYLDDFQSKR